MFGLFFFLFFCTTGLLTKDLNFHFLGMNFIFQECNFSVIFFMTDSIFFSMSLSMSYSEMSGLLLTTHKKPRKVLTTMREHCIVAMSYCSARSKSIKCIWFDIDLALISPLSDLYGVFSYLFMHGKLFIV